MDGEPPAIWYPSYAWRDPRWFEFDHETLSDLRLRAADASQGMPSAVLQIYCPTATSQNGAARA